MFDSKQVCAREVDLKTIDLPKKAHLTHPSAGENCHKKCIHHTAHAHYLLLSPPCLIDLNYKTFGSKTFCYYLCSISQNYAPHPAGLQGIVVITWIIDHVFHFQASFTPEDQPGAVACVHAKKKENVMQTTYIMTEECIDLIYSCITFPNLSQVGQSPGRALGGAVPCQAIQTNSCRLAHLPHITPPAL